MQLQDLAATNWLGAAALAFLASMCTPVVAVGLTLYNKAVSACSPLGTAEEVQWRLVVGL